MKLVVGLGNPGREYDFTRHNFGFLALDFYAKTRSLVFGSEPKFMGDIVMTDGLMLAKPQTFYNEVGECVTRIVNYYKLDPASELLVVCDDFDIGFGVLRYRERGSAGGNNGLKSVSRLLGTEDFARLRLGTGNSERRAMMDDASFVLSKFTPEEKARLPEILPEICEIIEGF